MTVAQPQPLPSGPSSPPTPTPQPTKPGIAGALTRKIGPLPVYGWAILLGGAGLVWRMSRGDSSTPTQMIPTTYIEPGASPTAGYINELGQQFKRIEDALAKVLERVPAKQAPVTPPPKPGTGTPGPISAKPLSRARAAEILRSKGLDPVKIIGWGSGGPPQESYWVNNQKYLWASETAFTSWVKRTFGK